jgi:hypothetical protein
MIIKIYMNKKAIKWNKKIYHVGMLKKLLTDIRKKCFDIICKPSKN